MPQDPNISLLCHRCGRDLHPGRGDFYVVRIEAFADPTPPSFSQEQLDEVDINEEISRLMEQMEHMSEQELLEQVHRRLTLHLCNRCYRAWIEAPAG